MFKNSSWYFTIQAIFCTIALVECPCASRPNNYKYLVYLTTANGEFLCSGTLISIYSVLTAGYCCGYNNLTNEIKVHAGPTSESGTIKEVIARKRFIHPIYNVCILQLRTALVPDSNITLIKVATPENFQNVMDMDICNGSLTLGYVPIDTQKRRFCIDACTTSSKDWINGTKQQLTVKRNLNSENCTDHTGGPVICGGLQVGVALTYRGSDSFTRLDRLYIFVMLHSYTSAANFLYLQPILILISSI